MLHRAAVTSERVLVTGASGGVGLAAVQLAKRRGATVSAVCSASKAADVTAQGADRTVDRDADVVDAPERGKRVQQPVQQRGPNDAVAGGTTANAPAV